MEVMLFSEREYLFYEELVARYDSNQQSLSSSEKQLLDFAFNADENNREKLSKGFPELIYIIRGWGSKRGFSDLVRDKSSWLAPKDWYSFHVARIKNLLRQEGEYLEDIEGDLAIARAKENGDI